jgi:hypothetical protein
MHRAILYTFLIPGLILLASSRLEAQEIRMDISMDDTTVEAVIQMLRTRTEVDFIFNHEELQKCPRVSIHLQNATVDEILSHCLEGTTLDFRHSYNTIVITPRNEPASIPGKKLRTQTLRGTVRDRDSGQPLPFASVVILETDPMRGMITDLQGRFRFEKLPVGRYTLKVSYVGYEEAVLSELLLGSARELVVEVDIREKSESIGEVFITYKKGEALNQMTSVSSISFNVEETKRYPVSVSDPARMVQVFAGVSGTDDATNEIVIRGNAPNWLLWRLEGVEIPSPNHFAEEGYSSGAVSILSTNLIGKSDFYTGAFPAEYGNALSGVFDMRLRQGNNQQREFAFQAGILGLELAAEGPFSKDYQGSYLVNYRYSTFSLMDQLNISISENALPNYQDLSFKFHLPTKKAGTFSIWGLGGLADDDEHYLPEEGSGENPLTGYRDYTESGMYATGISHTFYPDERSYLKTVVSHSMSYSSNHVQVMDSLWTLNTSFFDQLHSKALRISTLYHRKISAAWSLRAGLILSHLSYDYFSEGPQVSETPSFLDSEGSTHMYQAHIQSRLNLSDRWTLNTGLHFSHFLLTGDHSLEPRLGMRYRLPKQQTLSLAYGMHSKAEKLPVYFTEFRLEDGSFHQPNLNLEMARSHHFIAGYEKMFGSELLLKTEAYYQDIRRLPVPLNPDKYWAPIFGGIGTGDTLANIGQGRNMGLELTLQKFFTRHYFILFTTSLFDAKYRPADGEWYNSRYNLGHMMNLVGGREFMWGENKMIGVNLRFTWAGGKRYTPIDLDASVAQGQAVYEWGRIFSEQARDYLRMDLGINLHLYREKTEHVFSVEIQNLSNRNNVFTLYYDPYAALIREYPMTGLIPIFNYRIEF